MENEKKIDINLNTVIAETRQPASLIGSLLGKSYTKVENKDCYPGGNEQFEKDKATAIATAALMPNRSPRRYTIRLVDVQGIAYHTGLGNAVGIAINPQANGSYDALLPLLDGTNPVKTEKPLADAIDAALKGEGENLFFDASAVVSMLNEANKQEMRKVDALIDSLSKMKQSILTAIKENERKASEYERQWNSTKIDGVGVKDILGQNPQGIVNIHVTE